MILPAKDEVFNGDTQFKYRLRALPPKVQVRQAHILRGPPQWTTVWPRHYLKFSLPSGEDSEFAI